MATPRRGDGKLAEKIAAIKGKRDRHKALLGELDSIGENQISLMDPEARAMAHMTKVGVGYNIQLAVDVKHKLIAEQEVCNRVLDMGLLAYGYCRRQIDLQGLWIAQYGLPGNADSPREAEARAGLA